MNQSKAIFQKLFLFSTYILKRARQDRIPRVAASISYTSLIALVPLLAIALGIFSAFPKFEEMRGRVQNFLFEQLLPVADPSIKENIVQFISATHQLTIIGVIGLIGTAIIMLMTIETAFNAIFRVIRPRKIVTRILVYWTTITLGPLLIGMGLYISVQKMLMGHWFSPVMMAFAEIIPFFISVFFFMLLYIAVPNRPIRIRDAFIGGFVTTILFLLLKYFFAMFFTSGTTYHTLYGALAVLPVFLVWMYSLWVVILFGAVITAALPEWQHSHRLWETDEEKVGIISAALKILSALNKHFIKGEELSRTELLSAVNLPETQVKSVVEHLHNGKFVDTREEGELILTRDLKKATLADLCHALNIVLLGNELMLLSQHQAQNTIKNKFLHAAKIEKDTFAMTLEEVMSSMLLPQMKKGTTHVQKVKTALKKIAKKMPQKKKKASGPQKKKSVQRKKK